MPVPNSQVTVGAFFVTPGAKPQLRKVTELTTDDKNRTRVRYLSKSGLIPNRNFNFGTSKANPPLLSTFVAACDHLLTATEVADLRKSNIILSNE